MTDGDRLKVHVAGMEFCNPLILASGITDETGASMARAVAAGAGSVVTKSLSLAPRDGHPNPCIYEFEHGLINAMGLPNPGIDAYAEEVRSFRELLPEKTPLIASIFGASIEEYAEAASAASQMGIEAIEINGSCPNAKGLGLQFGQDPIVIRELVQNVKDEVKEPVFFKLTPNTQDIVALAEAAQEGGADGLVAINTVQAMRIDTRTGRPYLSNVCGGLSGPAIKPIGVRCVFDICSSENIRVPVIGVGGINGYEDVLEYMMAGASAVQIGTAVAWRDLAVFRRISGALTSFLDREGRGKLEEIVGMALEVKE